MITTQMLLEKIKDLDAQESKLLAQANAVVGARNMCFELLNILDTNRLNFEQKGDLINEPDRLEDRVY